MSAHHIDSPSVLGRRVLCPGSRALEVQAREQGVAFEDSEDAAEGMLLHERALATAGNYSGLSDDQALAVHRAREYLRAQLQGGEVLKEFPIVVWNPARPDTITRGTADAVGVFPGEVRVVDLKFGRSGLNIEMVRWQLKAYSVGAMQAFGRDRARAWIYQPREEAEADETFAGANQGAGYALEIEGVIEYAKAHHDEYHPSFAACRYCKGRSLCPAFREELVETLPVLAKKAELLDPAMLAELLDVASRAEPWCKAVKDAARKALEAGVKLPGWELKERRLRKVRDVDAAFGAVNDVLSQEQFLLTCDVRIGELEDDYARELVTKNGGTKAWARRRFAEATEGAVEVEVKRYLDRKEA